MIPHEAENIKPAELHAYINRNRKGIEYHKKHNKEWFAEQLKQSPWNRLFVDIITGKR